MARTSRPISELSSDMRASKLFDIKILPSSDCAAYLFSRFSANCLISRDHGGRGTPKHGCIPNSGKIRERKILTEKSTATPRPQNIPVISTGAKRSGQILRHRCISSAPLRKCKNLRKKRTNAPIALPRELSLEIARLPARAPNQRSSHRRSQFLPTTGSSVR